MAPPKEKAAAPSQALTLANMNFPTMLAVVLGFVVLLVVVYYLMFYGGLERDLAAERARGETLQTTMQRLNADATLYNRDLEELNRRRDRARDFRNVLPDNADIPGFMQNINSLAEGSGLQIRLILPTDERPERYYVRVPVRLEVRGQYLALARFFRAVSQLPRVINMENITLEQPTLVEGEVVLEARVLATTFRALPPTAAAAAAAPARGGR